MRKEPTDFGRQVADRILQAREDEWPKLFDDLRRSRTLFGAVYQMNNMLSLPTEREIAIDAFRRMGLWHVHDEV